MAVTADTYELPLAVFDTMQEAAIWAGVSRSTLNVTMYRGHSGMKRGYKFVPVVVEEDEEEYENRPY